jgi:hypothetical protein
VPAERTRASAQRHHGIVALLAGVGVALAVLVNLPFLSTYAVSGDDFAVLYHSASDFAPSPAEWVTSGYTGYDIVIPELSDTKADWIRPVLNASVYLQSLVIPAPTSVWFLTVNYIGHAVVVGLVFLVARRIAGLSVAQAVIAAVLFFGTTSSEGLFTSIAFRGDMLGALFTLAALLVTHSYLTGRPSRWKPVVIVALLLLAVFSKEAAIAGPFVVALYVVGSHWPSVRASGRLATARRVIAEQAVLLAGLALPVVLYGVARARAGIGGNYALEDLPNELFGVPLTVLNPFRFLLTAFFPVETDILKRIVSGWDLPTIQLRMAALRAALAVTVNALGWIAVVVALRRGPDRGRLRLLLLLGLAATALPILLKADPRFMYLGQTLLLPLLVAALVRLQLTRWQGRRLLRRARPAAAALLVVIGPVHLLTQSLLSQRELVAENDQANAIQVAAAQQLRDPAVHRLYLVNAAYQLVALQFVAAREGRRDVVLRVVDPVGYHPAPNEPGVGTSFRLKRDVLEVRVRLGTSQFGFGYVTRQGLDRLRTAKEISYGPITELGTNAWGKQQVKQKVLVFSIPDADRGDYAVVGFDPAVPGVHVYKQSEPTWRVVVDLPRRL